VAENHFEERVRVVRAALGDLPGRVELIFLRRTLNSGGSYVRATGVAVPARHEVQDVECLVLDDYLLRRPVSFIKIDVEGSEPRVFRGARRLLSEDRPIILSELLPIQLAQVSGCTPGDFIAEMDGCGYRCHALEDGQPGRWVTSVDELTSVVFLPK